MLPPIFRQALWTLALILSAMPAAARATEYFVSTHGDDSADGRTPATAFATIQKGVDALDPGDTLTIAPGEYFESVARENLGSSDVDTTIRAAIPGTAVLRGDVPGPPFKRVDATRFIYAATFDAATHGPPQAVIEHDTGAVLTRTPHVAELEFLPGLFHYDAEHRVLAISSSDMRPASDRRYSVSVLPTSGLYLKAPRRVVIDGIAATGFNRTGLADRGEPSQIWQIPWGIALDQPVGCTVRHCVTYFNAGGIGVDQGRHNVVEYCHAFANASKYQEVSGNIGFMGRQGDAASADNLIQHNRVSRGSLGIHFYGPLAGAGVIRDNIAWSNRGANLKIKTGRGEDNRRFGLIEHSISLDGWLSAVTTRHNLLQDDPNHTGPTDIDIAHNPDLNLQHAFADPDNLDFRLQPDAPFRAAGPDGVDQGPFHYRANIYYVSPDGNDDADGLSSQRPWRTLTRAAAELRPGDTLYLRGGTYSGDLVLESLGSSASGVAIRGRGRDPVILQGSVTITGSHGLSLERLNFAGPVTLRSSRDVTIHNCTFTGANTSVLAADSVGLRITHSLFSHVPLRLERTSGVHLSGNLYAHGGDAAAVALDGQSIVAYSDYNSYEDPSLCWEMSGGTLTLEQLQQHHDQHARVVAPQIDHDPHGAPRLRNASAFAGWGPLGTAIGVYHAYQPRPQPVTVHGPLVHSVTDTTANLEWWSSGAVPGGYHLTWGTHPDAPDAADAAGDVSALTIDAHRFASFSLTDLKPDTQYTLRIDFDAPVRSAAGEGETVQQLTIRFRTAASAVDPVTWYVAPDGSDAHSGRSRDEAWRTISHAADKARPGDTVLIASGTYAETVRIRATGAPGDPITFKAMPGHRVVLDGQDRELTCALWASSKAHLRFDGLYFVNFGLFTYTLPWSDRVPANGFGGLVALYRSRDVQFTRCFMDGRGPGYSPAFVIALHCPGLAIDNSVITAAMGGGLILWDCPGARIERNVFLQNLISHGEYVNEPDDPLYLAGNIFTDNLPVKVHAPILSIGRLESLRETGNCYYLRIPDAEKRPLEFYGTAAYGRPAAMFSLATEFPNPPVITELTRMSVAQYQQQHAPDSTSLVADPAFAGLRGVDASSEADASAYRVGLLMAKPDLDFADLFATNPQLIARKIGLDPHAFSDFHFHR